jgi:phage host-nuclease inhibitor protein Gam
MKKSNRIKVQLPSLTTRDEAEAAMRDLAISANMIRYLTAERDAEVLAINQRFETDLAKSQQQLASLTDALRVWAETHPEEFPKGRKSIDLTSGVLGFRTGTPKLALLSRAWNWDKVLHAIKLRAFNFIRTKEEVDKEAILAFVAAGPETPAELEAKICRPLGVKVVQEESFYIDPALTETESRQSQPAEAA